MQNEQDLADKIKKAESVSDIYSLVAQLQFETPSVRLSSAIARRLRSFGAGHDLGIALLSNVTVDLFPSHLMTALAAVNINSDCYIAPYGQYYQEVLSPQSQLHQYNPDLMILLLSLKELSPALYFRFAELTPVQRETEAKQLLEHIIGWVDTACEKFSASILVSNFVLPTSPQLGFADSQEDESEIEFFQGLNRDIRKALASNHKTYLLDLARLANRHGCEQAFDAKMYYMAKLIWTEAFVQQIAREISRFIVAAKGLARKCLVLDADNTLWGGVLGEDGINGIKVGIGDPVSEAFADFQRKIRMLKQRGVLLALCSKNNYEDVQDLFSERTELPLTMSDFAAVRINWKMKHQNIQEIANELNIGTDSLVFIDDNPAEVALIRQMLPEVLSLQVPINPENMTALLDNLPVFEKLQVLESDKGKTQQYVENRERAAHETQSNSVEDYLRSLGTKVYLRPVADSDLQRVHQLFTKTNQFNLTTIRYSLSEIKETLANENQDLWCYSVEDNFGNLGIVGLLLVDRSAHSASVESFVMSCRAMGRGIETAILNWLDRHYLGTLDLDQLEGEYIPTKKNKPVSDLFKIHGFEVVEENLGKTRYRRQKQQSPSASADWIDLKLI